MGIRKKFTILFLINIVFSFTIFVFIFSHHYRSHIIENARRRELGFSKGITEQILSLLKRGDMKDLRSHLIPLLRSIPQLGYVVLFSERGIPVLNLYKEGAPKVPMELIPDLAREDFRQTLLRFNEGFVRDTGLKIKAKGLSELHVGMDETFLHREINNFIWEIGGILFLCVIFGISIFYYICSHIFSRINRIQEGMKRFSQGDFNFRLREEGDKELISIIKTFNYMADSIERQREELEENNRRIAHLNSILRAVRNVNQRITRETDRNQLVEGICKDLVRTRGFDNTWIALLGKDLELLKFSSSGLENCLLYTSPSPRD